MNHLIGPGVNFCYFLLKFAPADISLYRSNATSRSLVTPFLRLDASRDLLIFHTVRELGK